MRSRSISSTCHSWGRFAAFILAIGLLSVPTVLTAQTKAGEEVSVMLPGDIPLQLIRIPAGTFTMGAPEGELGAEADEQPAHQVTLSQYYIGKYEITKAQWEAIMGTEPWSGSAYDLDYPNTPAINITFQNANVFIGALNAHADSTGQGHLAFRLPTEAEWERACRAMETERYYWGNDSGNERVRDYACYNGDKVIGGDLVGVRLPNAYGVYDMAGNVEEWCSDWYDYDYYSNPDTVNPTGPATGDLIVVRGGSWGDSSDMCRSASRRGAAASTNFSDLGFRVVADVSALTPHPDPDPYVDYDFVDHDAWTAHVFGNLGDAQFNEATGYPGTLDISSTDGDYQAGIWQSPVFILQEETSRHGDAFRAFDARTVYKADFRIMSNLTTPSLVPQIRMRATAEESLNTTLLTIESNGDSAYSPTPTGHDYSLLFQPAEPNTLFRLQFDLVNNNPLDASVATIMLDSTSVTAVPEEQWADPRTERVYDFESDVNGWITAEYAELFAVPEFAYDATNGRLGLSAQPAEGYMFGFWGSSLDPANNVTIEPGRLYFAEFTVSTDIENTKLLPTFRLRLNESQFRTGQLLNLPPSGLTPDVPSIGNPKTYRVFFPSYMGEGGNLYCSFDLLAIPQAQYVDFDGSVFLDRVEVRSVPIPEQTRTVMLPGDVPLELIRLPAGSFMMGAYPDEDEAFSDEYPRHQVRFSRDVYMGRYEVTKAQWEALIGTQPWSQAAYISWDPNSPAVVINLDSAKYFAEQLTTYVRANDSQFSLARLPTEAEWEYACRAGSIARYPWGNDPDYSEIDDFAWHYYNRLDYAEVGGRKLPNAWGFYDMIGNAWEWCGGWYGSRYYDVMPEVDPPGSIKAPSSGLAAVCKGGSWTHLPPNMRSATRGVVNVYSANPSNGFRIVLVP
ncbi:formylglycine-generating enzyme family protein [bacterium]|nr:formylglycine-generating enzyme family protein [bacterium]